MRTRKGKMITQSDLAYLKLDFAEYRLSEAVDALKCDKPTEAESAELCAVKKAFLMAYWEYVKAFRQEERKTSTRKERAWREFKLAEVRLSGAAVVIAESVTSDGKQPTAAELKGYHAATKAFVRARLGYSKAIEKEIEAEFPNLSKALGRVRSEYAKAIETEDDK